MSDFAGSGPRIDVFKLDGDLRDAYVELLSAQFAVERINSRYSADMVTQNGGSFLLQRSISAAAAICTYFRELEKHLSGVPHFA
jgi:hypothetical protein